MHKTSRYLTVNEDQMETSKEGAGAWLGMKRRRKTSPRFAACRASPRFPGPVAPPQGKGAAHPAEAPGPAGRAAGGRALPAGEGCRGAAGRAPALPAPVFNWWDPPPLHHPPPPPRRGVAGGQRRRVGPRRSG